MATKIAQDSSATFKGIIYQFYEALDRCFGLKENESLYIEKKGDIAIIGRKSISIEVKHYGDDLTDSHSNFWKTLSNFLKSEFEHEQFKSLLLITTQKISTKSSFMNWNEKTAKQREDILEDICNIRIGKGEELNSYQKNVSTYFKKENLRNVLSKLEIFDASESFFDKYSNLVDGNAKHLGPDRIVREQYINSLVGYILTPKVLEGNSWVITFDDFSNECSHMSEKLMVKTRVFPKKTGCKAGSFSGDELFIKKIKEINYHEVIDDAHNDYIETLQIVDEHFKQGTPLSNYKSFEEEVVRLFLSEYRFAKRNIREVVSCSQGLYDNCQRLAIPTFSQYETPHSWFRNGVMHVNMDDPDQKFKWKLSDD